MRSSDGQYFAGLDHIRALAAFLVFFWHFAHFDDGSPVPFNQTPLLGLLDEGHVGVSLFMTLSGYLFAKLVGGRNIDYAAFLWNRAVRLLPLLVLVLVLVGLRDYLDNLRGYFVLIASGAILPRLPNGGWSITVEAHFYVLLPLLLWFAAKSRWFLIGLVGVSVVARVALYIAGFDVQDLAYWTIAGRIDQFLFGIFFAQRQTSGRAAILAAFLIYGTYFLFDLSGGFNSGPDWPWIFLGALEGLTFGAIISWYDANPIRSSKMWLVQKAGEYSYSIYLLHFFIVFYAAKMIDQHVMRLDNLYLALPWAMLAFLFMIGVGHVCFKFVEEPPLRFRKPYIRRNEPIGNADLSTT